MTLQQLEYIVALDDERHFVRAAEKCQVTQPTLSMQVQKLEDDLGVLIFDRKTHPLQPTVVGEKIVSRARSLLREAREVRALVSTEKGEMKGEFRLGVIPTLAPSLVPRFLKDFLDQYPDISLRIDELQTEQIIDMLMEGQLDVGIMVGPVGQSRLSEMPIFHEPFLLYAHEGAAVAEKAEVLPEHLDSADMWILNQGHCFRTQMLNICETNAGASSPRYSYETGSVETLKKMVQASGGYTLVPELSMEGEAKREGIVTRRFAPPEPVRVVMLVTHHGFARNTFLESLRTAILSSLPPSMKIEGGKKVSIEAGNPI